MAAPTIATCVDCGQRNRLPAVVLPGTRAACGKCRGQLLVETCDACDGPGPVDADGYCAACAATVSL